MNKFAKLSLASAIALASLTSAQAGSLEEAVKNVDISGTVAYRYNDYEENAAKDNSSTTNYYKAAINLKSQVNDDIMLNTRIIAGDSTNAGEVGLDAQAASDANVSVFLSEVNFTYTGIANTAIVVGKQAINTSFTMARDSIGNEHTGTGIVASTNVGPVNLFGAYFNQTNFNNSNESGVTLVGSEDTAAVGASASFAGINVDASYLDITDTLDAYTVGLDASYKVGEVGLNSYARYSELELDSATTDNSLWKVGVKANVGIFGAYVAYGETGKDGGVVGLDASSATGFDEHWRVTLSTISDASTVYAAVDAQVTDKINVALKYSDLDAGTNSNSTDQTEVYTQVAYLMSKNLLTYVRFGELEVKDKFGANSDLKSTIGRLHVQYSF